MLRNSPRSLFIYHQWKREISGSCSNSSKNSSNANRQGKILNKLFGERLSGSKKRWFPMDTTTQSKPGANFIFKASHLSKPGGAGKNTLRRSAVLNKLFMEQISSLLATGTIADCFLGRGLQLTRVKISPDFACVNVYWMATGDPMSDNKLSEDLHQYSGYLRHELSQLRVMGEVPRIHFVRDKMFANMEHVEAVLNSIDLSQENCDSEDEKTSFQPSTSERVKQDFYGNREILENNTETEQTESLPPMRHDVFGLDHRGIMSKILAKMKRSRHAWETHTERQERVLLQSTDPMETTESPSLLKSVEQKIDELNSSDSDSGFKKFLAQKRDRRNTPERKKYRKEDNIIFIDSLNDTGHDVMTSKHQKDVLNEDDYVHEDYGNDRKL